MTTYSVALYSSWPALWFSADSWAYYELARSLSSEKPYAFWTFRSYWSHEYSASFPFGYPSVLWVLHRLFGEHPGTGVAFNCAIAALTPWAACGLAKRAFGKLHYGFYPAIALLLYRDYMYEVVIAGALPLAILVSILGISRMFASGNALANSTAAGFLLGCAILIRFDQLIFWGLAAVYLAWLRRSLTCVALYAIGGMIAVSPWIVYSMSHFGAAWASDNSWVALSSTKAYVIDYPARAKDTLFSHPLEWVMKCLSNFVLMIKAVFMGLYRFPFIAVIFGYLGFCGIMRSYKNSRNQVIPGVILPLLTFLSLLPQVMTGYTDARYYSAMFLFCGISMTFALCSESEDTEPKRLPAAVLIVAVLASAAMALNYSLDLLHGRNRGIAENESDEKHLRALADVHAKESEILYVFPEGSSVQLSKYGALFRRRAGFLPSNWKSLDESTRQAFREEFAPMKFIEWKNPM